MYIFVGSTNPVKVNAVTQAASETWPDVKVMGYGVASGIDAQPRSDEETRQGARNRAAAALKAGQNEQMSAQALGVGLEGGVFELGEELWSTVWVVVTDGTGRFFEANGARFKIDDVLADIIKAGEEMGPVVARVTGVNDVRSKQGMIGVVTGGFVDRTEEYSSIAKLALGLWYGREWNS
jgi:inosine/xanthosine triphosphatase